MQQSGRSRGFRSLCAVVGAAGGLWLAGCAPDDDWELSEIGVEQEMAELAAEEAGQRLEDEVDEAESEGEGDERVELAAEEAGQRLEAEADEAESEGEADERVELTAEGAGQRLEAEADEARGWR